MNTPRQRRALTSVGGDVNTHGDDGFDELLREAWAGVAQDADTLTHGFHTYPARMHPRLAARLVASLSHPGETIVDPFCGGGTVLVEAMVAGRRTYGIDLNPVAVRLARVRVQRRDAAARERFAEKLGAVVEASLDRVHRRVRAKAPLSVEQRREYFSHVLLELAGLYEEIQLVEPIVDRHALMMLLSAIVVKFSKRRADTADDAADKRIGKKVVSGFFGRKGQELIDRWARLDEACAQAEGEHIYRPRVLEGDAREAARILPRKVRAHAIISSPPYAGTYDYVDHHTLRYPWLGASPAKMRRAELGARRNLSAQADPEAARNRWDEEVVAMLRSMSEVLDPGGIIALVMGDGEIGTTRIEADVQLGLLAPRAGLRLVASADQPRVDFRGGRPRREHILLLRPDLAQDG